MSGICLYCQRALGCPLLFGKDGKFDPNRLFTEKSTRQCVEYVEITGTREKGVRERLYHSFGLAYLHTLHELPELVMAGLHQGEKDELMYENVPNFQDPTLLWEGMTSVEREDVLRHQTDETGGIIVETDSEGVQHQLARPEYHIKAYMCDPEGPIRADKAVTWVWNINQVVDYILKTEAEQGLIIKVKKPSPATEPTEQPEESETNMPGPGRPTRTVVRSAGATPAASKPAAVPAKAATKPSAAPAGGPAPIRRAQPKPATAPAGAPARAPARAPAPASASPAPAGGRVANPPARRVATPAGAPGRAMARPVGATSVASAVAAQNQTAEATGNISDQMERAVFKIVNPMYEELLGAVKAAHQAVIDYTTILGDIAGQTGGTFRVKKVDAENNFIFRENGTPVMEAPQLFATKSKLYAYIDGTAFDHENMLTILEDGEPEGMYDPPVEEEEVPAEEQAEEPAEGEG